MLDDAVAVLDLADEQIAEVEAIYKESLEEKKVSPRLQALAKNAIENKRSALDYVAHAIVETEGKKGAKSYWPYAIKSGDFDKYFNSNLPGVAKARSDIKDAVEQYQPFQPGYEWIEDLMELTNENKHRKLTAQSQTRTVRNEVRGQGGSVSWDPQGVTFGDGVSIMGESVNPATQRTASTQTVVYVDWLYSDSEKSALAVATQDVVPTRRAESRVPCGRESHVVG